MNRVVVLIAVGPSPTEIERLHDFFAALWHWEPQINSIVLIDDSLESRGLDRLFSVPEGVKLHTFLHPRKGVGVGVWGGLTEGIVLGLNWIAENENADMVLKTDTDALIIAPFVEKAGAFFEANPKAGVIGLHDRHCSGEARHFRGWDIAMRKYAMPIGIHPRTPGLQHKIKMQLFGESGAQRRIIQRARSHGYQWGEHCLGGAYLLRFETVRDMYAQGLLSQAAFWRRTLVSEDVVIGAYTIASGWDLKGFAAPGEVFGIEYMGLPFSPAELEAKGYGIIHSVNNDKNFSEEQIRAFFQARRQVRLSL